MNGMPSDGPDLLRHSIAEYVQGVCACLEAAKDAHAVEALLQQAKGLLFPAEPSQRDPVPAAGPSSTPVGLPPAEDVTFSAPPTAASDQPRLPV